MGYQLFLTASYKVGDLTQVYPIARGTAPLWVTAFSLFILGISFSALQYLGVLAIGVGLISLALVRRRDGLRNPLAAVFALITGCFIAGYSLNDGLGARVAETALGFYGWATLLNVTIFAVYIALAHPGVLSRLPKEGKMVFFVGGNASFIAYVMVVWAFTQAPIALVTALRETSIVFALMIGVFVLKERFDIAKFFATALTILGAVLLKIARN